MIDLKQAALASAITCPHPAARRRHSIAVQGRDGSWMVVCGVCSETMKSLVRAWHAYAIKPSTVYRQLRTLDYSRVDAARFVVQLALDRIQVRLGLLSRRAVDV